MAPILQKPLSIENEAKEWYVGNGKEFIWKNKPFLIENGVRELQKKSKNWLL